MATEPGGPTAAGALPEFVGRYRILERIGKGAMGVVFAALDEQIDRKVAVKLLLGDLEEEPEIRERFLREARITGQLAHRNVVTLYDLGEEHGRMFIVMELLNGLPLTEFLQTPAGRTLDGKLDVMIQVCAGLQSAHSRGVIHRDVKPSNLFILHDGTVKILDFGVARLASSNLTASGFLIGTPEYMSPEQTQGRTVDQRSDIFSAGAVFYFMLTGRSAFASKDLRQMLNAIINEQPTPLTDADAPEAVRRIVMKALAKSPAERYQHCADLMADLERARRATDSATRRIVQAALDRYRQTVSILEERRALARALKIDAGDQAAQAALGRLAARFPEFANAGAPASIDGMDRMAANEALEEIQVRYNAELAELAAMREAATEPARQAPGEESGEPASWKARAAALWRNLNTPRE
jgi:serine/threonine protein kinase